MTIFDLSKKVAVVTGGGKGIGRSVSIMLARQNAIVYIIDIDKKAGYATADSIVSEGFRATSLACNIANQAETAECFDKIAEREGRLNILVNNAGIAHVGNVETTTEEDLDRVFSVNVKGAFNCLKAAIRHMKKNGGGSIVNMVSVAAMVGLNERFAYSASKGALQAMTYSIAKDYLSYNIRCNSISPGRVHTPFVDGFLKKNYPGREKEMFEMLSRTQPVGRMGKPDEIAGLVVYLCSDEAAFVTGSNYVIDGGIVALNS